MYHKEDSNDGGEQQYDKLPVVGGSATVTAKEWTKIEGTLTVVWSGDLETLTIKLSEQGDALEDGTYGSYYVANVSLKEVQKAKKKYNTILKI